MNKTDEKQLNALFAFLPSLSRADKKKIENAYFFAKNAHRGVKRSSGGPYFLHVYKTALKLAELKMDTATIVAGLLHDTIEDAHVAEIDIEQHFGVEVLFLVRGVTKLGKLKYHGLERYTESLRKLLIAMSQDVRVLIIKLADRLHNMKTLEHIPENKQKRIALETLEIYAPLAHRLGIGSLKGELEDLAFPFVYPKEYKETAKILKQKSKEGVRRLEKVTRTLKRLFGDESIRDFKTDYRVKHLYSFFKKLSRKDMNVDKVYDLAALRIIVKTVEDCYKVLGIIHKKWKPLPNRIKDYIANPKPNGYRSLHTTVFTGDGGIVEIQIRTPEMHREAEFGVASHVAYKEGGNSENVSWIDRLLGRNGNESGAAPAPEWFQELVESQRGTAGPQEFLKNLKADFFGERVFTFTPKGEVVDLPLGSTPVDFAYAIHSDVGDRLSGAKINGKLVSIDTPLKHGDIVEAQTSRNSKPTRKWLEYAHTTLAKRRIRAALRN